MRLRLAVFAFAALVLLAPPLFAIDATSFNMDSTPAAYEGPCPVTLTFKGTFTVDAAGTVDVWWERSDGATAPVQKIAFPAAGSKAVTTTWTLGDYTPTFQKAVFWQKLHVKGATDKTGYRGSMVTCNKAPAKFDLVPAVHTPMDGFVSVHNNGPDPSPVVTVMFQCNKDGLPIDKGCPPFPAALGANPGYDGSGIPVGGWGVVSAQLIWIRVPSLPGGQTFTLSFPWWSQLKFDPGTYHFPVQVGATVPPDTNTANDKVVDQLTVASPLPKLPVGTPSRAK